MAESSDKDKEALLATATEHDDGEDELAAAHPPPAEPEPSPEPEPTPVPSPPTAPAAAREAPPSPSPARSALPLPLAPAPESERDEEPTETLLDSPRERPISTTSSGISYEEVGFDDAASTWTEAAPGIPGSPARSVGSIYSSNSHQTIYATLAAGGGATPTGGLSRVVTGTGVREHEIPLVLGVAVVDFNHLVSRAARGGGSWACSWRCPAAEEPRAPRVVLPPRP